MMLTAVKFCLLMFSMTGYFLFFTRRFQIRMEFAPALVCAWISNLLFAGGILNCLPQTARLIFAGGYLLLALSLKNRYRFSRRDGMLYGGFLIVLVYFSWVLRGAHFTSYDNFSHWATVVKDMLLADRMPNFEDFMIRFQSYPLGSSLFIYYICRIAGTGDACFLWAQLLMLLSFLFCLAAFVRRKSWYWMILPALFGIWALTVNNSIYELRVDTLLPLAGIAVFAVIYYYKGEPQKAVYCSMGLFVLLINIKNSGFFFYGAGILGLFVYAGKYIRGHRVFFFNTCLLCPLMAFFLWKRHVALVFEAGMETKHAMSLANYGQELAEKSADDLRRIGLNMLRRSASLENPEVQMLLFTALLAAVLILGRRQAGRVFRLLAADWGCLAVYTVFMYAMYVLSMPLGEALELASYDRYMLTVLIFIYGITVIWVTDAGSGAAEGPPGAWSGAKGRPAGMLAAAVLLLAVCPLWLARERLPLLLQKPDYAGTKRCSLQTMMERDGIETGSSYFIYCTGTAEDARYLFYLSRYEFWSPDILVVREDRFEENRQKIGDYDYFIIWDSDENTDQYLAEQGLAEYQGMERIGLAAETKRTLAFPG